MLLAAIGRATTAAQSLLQRAIHVKRYTPASLDDRLARGSRFLADALAGPKAWRIGSEEALAPADPTSNTTVRRYLESGSLEVRGPLSRDRKSTRLNSSHMPVSRMPSSA